MWRVIRCDLFADRKLLRCNIAIIVVYYHSLKSIYQLVSSPNQVFPLNARVVRVMIWWQDVNYFLALTTKLTTKSLILNSGSILKDTLMLASCVARIVMNNYNYGIYINLIIICCIFLSGIGSANVLEAMPLNKIASGPQSQEEKISSGRGSNPQTANKFAKPTWYNFRIDTLFLRQNNIRIY